MNPFSVEEVAELSSFGETATLYLSRAPGHVARTNKTDLH
jgi:hypothetical protein